MADPFTCPQCRTAFLVPENAYGKKVRCPHCKAIVQVPALQPAPVPVAPPPPPVAMEDALPWTRDARPIEREPEPEIRLVEEEPRPKKRRGDDDRNSSGSLERQWSSVASGFATIRWGLLLYLAAISLFFGAIGYILYEQFQRRADGAIFQQVGRQQAGDVVGILFIVGAGLLLLGLVIECIGRIIASGVPRGVVGRALARGSMYMSILAILALVGFIVSITTNELPDTEAERETKLYFAVAIIETALLFGVLWNIALLYSIANALRDEWLHRVAVRFTMLVGWTTMMMIVVGFSLWSYLIFARPVPYETFQAMMGGIIATGFLGSFILLSSYMATLHKFRMAIEDRLYADGESRRGKRRER